jgi:uncharacterized protein with PIN domain
VIVAVVLGESHSERLSEILSDEEVLKMSAATAVEVNAANVTGEPLLFVGDDFAHTDVTPAYQL